LRAKVTEPVGVPALDGPLVTLALNVVEGEPVATTKSLVLDWASDIGPAEAAGAGAGADTTTTAARTKPATSAQIP
jgi:hypothetical protein